MIMYAVRYFVWQVCSNGLSCAKPITLLRFVIDLLAGLNTIVDVENV